MAAYSDRYEDPNGYHEEYVRWAWKWWLIRNCNGVVLRQIRRLDFSEFDTTGKVCFRLFSLFRAVRYDDQPFGHGYDGTLRLPRHADEEVVYTWIKEEDGAWRILRTDPALPNMAEVLWNNRLCDQTNLRLQPGVDNHAPFTPPEDAWIAPARGHASRQPPPPARNSASLSGAGCGNTGPSARKVGLPFTSSGWSFTGKADL